MGLIDVVAHTINLSSSINTKPTQEISPTIPSLSKSDEAKFGNAKNNFENYKNKIFFNENIIGQSLKEKIPYEIEESLLKEAVNGLPKNTPQEKYFLDIEKNNDLGEITLRIFGRALYFEKTAEDFETYTALLWQKNLYGFKKFSTLKIIEERSIGFSIFNSSSYMNDLSNACVKSHINNYECSNLLNKTYDEKNFTKKTNGSAFVARKEKNKPIYYIATNSHVISPTLNAYQEKLNARQKINKYANKNYFNLKKNHAIDATELSQFFEFTQNYNTFSREKNTIKSVRLVHNLISNDDLFVPKENFSEIDLAILKVEFSSINNDPFAKWWDKRPTKTRPMNISDFLNGYDPTKNDDRPNEKKSNTSLEKGIKVKQIFLVGSYGILDEVCYGEQDDTKRKFKLHYANSRNDWKIQSSFSPQIKNFTSKLGTINYLNRAKTTFSGSSGSPVFDKNLNIVAQNFGRISWLTKDEKNDTNTCKQTTWKNKGHYHWFSFDQETKDFFNLKNNRDVFNFVLQSENWKKDFLYLKQIKNKLYDYSKLLFGDTKLVLNSKKLVK